MPRDISAPMLAALSTFRVRPAILAQIGFKSQTQYVWSGIGTLTYDGHDYLGVGNLGKFSRVTSGLDLAANGIQLALSGIDPNLLSESLNDIQLGAPAKLLFALLDDAGAILGAPYFLFSGIVDRPVITPGVNAITIGLALETRFANLQRPNARRYTAADQMLHYPSDSAFIWVEQLNDQAVKWG